MSLPPGVLAPELVGAFPQLILCDAELSATLAGYLSPSSNPAMSDFVQWLQDNPAAATAAGNILNPPGAPQTAAGPLDASLVGALAPLLTSTSSWIVTQSAFEGVAWTVQSGVVPGPVTPQPAGDAWTIATQSPAGGLVFSGIAYSGAPTPGFTLTLLNDAPRHLSVYAEFLSAGTPVAPAGWTSRLPKGAPAGLETDAVKYLGVLMPNGSVAGLSLPGTAQTLTCPLPANADSVSILFGGLGANGFSAIPDAAGVLLSFVLDVFVPWVVAFSGQSPTGLSKWYSGLLADASLMGKVLTSGEFLTGVSGQDALFSALSANMTSVMLGDPLAGLRDSIAEELGSPPGVDHGWVDQLAPAAGWAAQLVEVYLDGGAAPQFWAAATPSPIALDLSPASALALEVTLQPDPRTGIWPYTARSCTVDIAYDHGFSQTRTCAVPAAQSTAPIAVTFGAVPNGGPVAISARILDASASLIARADTSVTPPVPPASRDLPASLAVRDVPASLDATTQYARVARLAYGSGSYAWNMGAGSSTEAGSPPPAANVPAVTELTCLTLQGDALCLGYAWRASNQQTQVCGGSAPLQAPYYIQNIGTAVPSADLETIQCGLVAAPQLAYAPAGAAGGYYVDTQGTGIFLRPVRFGPGTFDLASGVSVARFPGQSTAIALCVHPDGYAAAVNADASILGIVALADTPVADAQAPMALSHCGPGSRIGLLRSPVAVAAMPNGAFIVLEQGNARVQAFDVQANPLPMFAGQCSFALRSAPQTACLDLAVSPSGAIFVLGSQNGGGAASDCFLDIYDPDGALLTSTPGVRAAKIALDAASTLYTLDFDTFTGPGGRIEPVLSIWRPRS